MLARLVNSLNFTPVAPNPPKDLPPELIQMGVRFEQWDVQNVDLTHVSLQKPTDALIEEIVKNNPALLQRLYDFRTTEGYMDLVNLHPETPGLSELLVKFQTVHDHPMSEIRLILGGEGTFNIYNEYNQKFVIQVEKGDFLVIPAGVFHNFQLTDTQTVQALRVFQKREE